MAKTKHVIRNSIMSFYKRHTDPEKHEKLEAIRKDMEVKKAEILKIVQKAVDGDQLERGPIVDLIEDFHKQYESLYTQYDHITVELKNKADKNNRDNEISSSSSDSDSGSDSDSSKAKGSKDRKMKNDTRQATDGFHQELEAAKVKATLLESRLKDVCFEKETIELAYDALTSKLESTEKVVKDLKTETEGLNSEKSYLLAENKDLNSKLEGSVKAEVDLKQQIEQLVRDKDSLAIEHENDKTLKAELTKLRTEKQTLELELDSAKQRTLNLEETLKVIAEENKILSLKISDLTNELLQAQKNVEEIKAEHANSKVRLDEQHRELVSLQQARTSKNQEQIEVSEEEYSRTKLDLDTVMREKRELEERFEGATTEASKMAREVSELRAKISQTENLLKGREDQISSLLNKLEVNESESKSAVEALTVKVNDSSAKKSRLEKQMSVKSSEVSTPIKELTEHISGLQHEVNTLKVHNREMKLELERKGDEIAEYLTQIEGLNEKLSNSNNLKKKYIDEKEKLAAKLKGIESGVETETLTDEADQLMEEIRKLQDRVDELEKDVKKKDKLVAELKRMIQVLRRDVEVAKEEANTSLEKTSRFEVQFRLSNQKLRLTEQLLAEKEENYKIAAERFHEECKLLEDEVSRLSEALAASKGVVSSIPENIKNTVAGMEFITKKFEDDNEKFSSRIFNMSEEINILKHCVAEKNIEREKLEQQLRKLTEELESEKEHGLSVRNDLSKLEREAENEKGEKEKLLAALNELKKTTEDLDVIHKKRNEQVMILEDEKREAIRQLCLWNDNLQNRYNKLKDMVIKSSFTKTVE
ncbi:hypothetical protein vseg_020176 [Gypsophila vaccaria]